MRFYLRTTAESERNAPTATSGDKENILSGLNDLIKTKITNIRHRKLFVTALLTLVAVVIDVNARAQGLAEHPEVTTQRGSSDPLKTHTCHAEYQGKDLK